MDEYRTDTRRIDAVLPLTAADAERFERLLLPSLQAFFAPLGTCWVVAPRAQLPRIAPRLRDRRCQLLAEEELIPELDTYRQWLHRVGAATGAGAGWFVQQLVKLLAAGCVRTPFYLTLDADVLCVRPVRSADLIVDGRALVYVHDDDAEPAWYRWAERALGMPRSGRVHGVTPALLSAAAVQRLCYSLRSRADTERAATSCAAALLRRLPWTEYALYHTFLEHTGLFDRYHVATRDRPLYGNCGWYAADFDRWDPAASFAPDAPHCFSVVQSRAGIPVDVVAARVAPYLPAPQEHPVRPIAPAAGGT